MRTRRKRTSRCGLSHLGVVLAAPGRGRADRARVDSSLTFDLDRGYPSDHPRAELLRRRSLVATVRAPEVDGHPPARPREYSWAGDAGAVDDQLCSFAPVLPQRQYLLGIRGGRRLCPIGQLAHPAGLFTGAAVSGEL